MGRILSMANIHGGLEQVMIIENMGGLIVGSTMERLNGNARILACFDGQTCQLEWIKKFNFSEKVAEQIIKVHLQTFDVELDSATKAMEEEKEAKRIKLLHDGKDKDGNPLLTKLDSGEIIPSTILFY